jgi:hypothetical protein
VYFFHLGTGKSSVNAGIISNLISNNKLLEEKKALVCAPSNNACDVLASHILQRLPPQAKHGNLY